jgi:hypothetical protein
MSRERELEILRKRCWNLERELRVYDYALKAIGRKGIPRAYFTEFLDRARSIFKEERVCGEPMVRVDDLEPTSCVLPHGHFLWHSYELKDIDKHR